MSRAASGVGTCRRRVRPVGPDRSVACIPDRRPGRCRLLGDRRAQVAERSVRLRHRPGPAARGPAPQLRRGGRLSALRYRFRGCESHAPVLTARPANRDMGGAAHPRPPGVTDLITRACDHAQAMAAYAGQAGLEVLNDVVLNQVLVRAASDEQTLALIEAVQQDGTCWWADRVAASPGHADQRFRLGDNRRGHQAKRRRHYRRNGRDLSLAITPKLDIGSRRELRTALDRLGLDRPAAYA